MCMCVCVSVRDYAPTYVRASIHTYKHANISTTVHIITSLLRNVRACIVVAVWIGMHVNVCMRA